MAGWLVGFTPARPPLILSRMAILKIARMGHPVLRGVAQPVANPTAPEIRRLVADMVETLEDIGGAGFAPPPAHSPPPPLFFPPPYPPRPPPPRPPPPDPPPHPPP